MSFRGFQQLHGAVMQIMKIIMMLLQKKEGFIPFFLPLIFLAGSFAYSFGMSPRPSDKKSAINEKKLFTNAGLLPKDVKQYSLSLFIGFDSLEGVELVKLCIKEWKKQVFSGECEKEEKFLWPLLFPRTMQNKRQINAKFEEDLVKEKKGVFQHKDLAAFCLFFKVRYYPVGVDCRELELYPRELKTVFYIKNLYRLDVAGSFIDEQESDDQCSDFDFCQLSVSAAAEEQRRLYGNDVARQFESETSCKSLALVCFPCGTEKILQKIVDNKSFRPRLQKLKVVSSVLPPEALKLFGELTGLKKLTLKYVRSEGENDLVLNSVSNCPSNNIEELSLKGQDPSWIKLANPENLKVLRSKHSFVTSDSLKNMPKNLRVLDLSYSKQFGGDVIEAIGLLINLVELYLVGTKIRSHELSSITQKLKNKLRILAVDHCKKLQDAKFASPLKGLEELHMGSIKLKESELCNVPSSVAHLDVSEMKITKLSSLGGLSNLQTLYFIFAGEDVSKLDYFFDREKFPELQLLCIIGSDDVSSSASLLTKKALGERGISLHFADPEFAE